MSRFLKKDPVKKAKKHIDRALQELEDGYADYASQEYEKAAHLFLEADEEDFAVKYFRESSYCAIQNNDHERAASMKIQAADVLLRDGRFDEGGGLYSEASDHLFRQKKVKESTRIASVGILAYLAARSFDTGVNLIRKLDHRISGMSIGKVPTLELARLSVNILCEGGDVPAKMLKNAINAAKPRPAEQALFSFLTESVKIARDTEVVVEWAGRAQDEVQAKTPVEFELRYKCPAPVRVVNYRTSLSTSLKFTKEPTIEQKVAKQDSWLLEVLPVLSGSGTVGPFSLTLEGENVLVNKMSNALEFRITRPPSDLSVEISPETVSCGLGDEAILDVTFINEGEGSAENIKMTVELSEGLELSLGGSEKVIEFIGPKERMRFQLFVRGMALGDETVTVKAEGSRKGEETTNSSTIRVA
ncbi:MAG: hypothetical protein AM324_009805 [Candidatus Thorarchaeota archaeon SMTZ1-83]|nr:MAG: hypothetical protein AM324_11235 [Candidatus Thorarchaeota archaeon SMTZ1-83]